ncbi:hypothetical protein [Rhodospirillum centenum]|uniref:Uncharacterized protein n=1 Tax=Rhodospirillum centenum (strain ATCC 51521 / SW) TaxID=414684 RepID=B6IR15_RHOCS|nr:hypothetical protein [Rhodospirillum centenum]ACI97901.1 hypothetical protein RC1_0464 [Rhodospirillum centenum SW]
MRTVPPGPDDTFASHVPAWKIPGLRARLTAAEHEGRLGEPCGHEHRALVRRWARGYALHSRQQAEKERQGKAGRAPGGWKAGAERGPGTGRRRIATGARLKAIEAATAASFAPRDWLTAELLPGDIVRAYEATQDPLRAMGSVRPSYRRYLQWLHWRRSLGPVADLRVEAGPVLRHHPELREFGLAHQGAGLYRGTVEGELVPTLRVFCARHRIPLRVLPGAG